MTPVPVRTTVPSAVVGVVIALCALLLLKWLALVGIAAVGLGLAVRWIWRHRAATDDDRSRPVPPGPSGPSATPAPGPADVLRLAGLSVGSAGSAGSCTWCGLAGGHRAADGSPVRPRHVHVLR